MIVVKLGGSLFDHPKLRVGLRRWLDQLLDQHAEPILLVPGGGAFADVVRDLDRIHAIGEDAAHWLAIDSLALSAAFLTQLLTTSTSILNARSFCESVPDLPHTWHVTTDSIALRAAIAYNARELILLKSTDIPPHTSWSTAAVNGWVDDYFPSLAKDYLGTITAIHFRRWLDDMPV